MVQTRVSDHSIHDGRGSWSFIMPLINYGQGASANNFTKTLRAKHQYGGPRLHSENSSPSYIVNYNIFPISLDNWARNLVTPPVSERWAHELSSDPEADNSRTFMKDSPESPPRTWPAYDADGFVFTRLHPYSTNMWRRVAPSLHMHLAPRRTSLYSYWSIILSKSILRQHTCNLIYPTSDWPVQQSAKRTK
jgi:hypothetical protein